VLQPGDIIDNKYTIVRKIASAGFGTVYEGWHERLGRKVAIKAILPGLAEEERFMHMFEDEARNTANLNHENIVQVYDFIIDAQKGQFFMVMQLIDGKDLRQIMKQIRTQSPKGKMPYDLVAYIISRTCSALAYAHEREDPQTGKKLDLVHRDVSPSNIMVAYNGVVKLMDFGIAKAEGRKSEHTRTGVLKGKISYMSPEQAMGQKLEGQSDIYSLGIVMFELLTFKKAFQGNTDLDVLQKVAKGEIDTSALDDPDIPPALKAITLKATERDMSKRYQTAQEMYLDLHKYFSSIDSQSMQSKLAKYMQKLFAEELKQRDSAPEVPPRTLNTSVGDVSEMATGVITRPSTVSPPPTPASTQPSPSFKLSRPIIAGSIGLVLFILAFLFIPRLFPSTYGVIDSIPTGADVKINGTYLGSTPFQVRSEHVRPGKQYDLVLSHPNFFDLHHVLVIDDKKNMRVDGAELLNANENAYRLRFQAQLNISTIPPKGKILLQNEEIGVAPLEYIYEASEIPLNLRATFPGLDSPDPLVVNLASGATSNSTSWEIESLRQGVYRIVGKFNRRVTINAVPPGAADLFVDGKPMGPVPIELSLPFGEHEIRIDRGDLSSGNEVFVVSQTDSVFNLVLKKKVRFKAFAAATNEPLPANITIYDGDNRKISSGSAPALLAVPAGNATAEFEYSGYKTVQVPVNASRDTLIEVQLDIIRPVIVVEVTDTNGNKLSGVSVRSDTGFKARTNALGVAVLEVSPNRTHEFSVEKEGYRPLRGLKVSVGPSGRKKLPAVLRPR